MTITIEEMERACCEKIKLKHEFEPIGRGTRRICKRCGHNAWLTDGDRPCRLSGAALVDALKARCVDTGHNWQTSAHCQVRGGPKYRAEIEGVTWLEEAVADTEHKAFIKSYYAAFCKGDAE